MLVAHAALLHAAETRTHDVARPLPTHTSGLALPHPPTPTPPYHEIPAANSVEWMLTIRACDMLSGTIGGAGRGGSSCHSCSSSLEPPQQQAAQGAAPDVGAARTGRMRVVATGPSLRPAWQAAVVPLGTTSTPPALPPPPPAVPIYDSLGESAVEYIANHSGAWSGRRLRSGVRW